MYLVNLAFVAQVIERKLSSSNEIGEPLHICHILDGYDHHLYPYL